MEMKHQNVCAFVGACIEPNKALLLWEYCAKGSLQDVIWNQNIKLDQMFMFALSHDVAKVIYNCFTDTHIGTLHLKITFYLCIMLVFYLYKPGISGSLPESVLINML